ncbi:GntR family transcriptional regulator, partial [Butyricicoccus sp. 1XD8-22]
MVTRKGGEILNLNADSTTPIYVQIADWIENEILANRLTTDGKVFSQYQLAEMFNINPATAGKGLTILLENNILYKKRGLGMFVQEGAKELILSKRRDEKLTMLAKEIVLEAKRLFVSDEELINLIKKVQ